MKSILKALIWGYQCIVSPLFPACCRFYPSCSQYALSAIDEYGVLKGGLMVVKRLSKCHPFHPGGYDPVK